MNSFTKYLLLLMIFVSSGIMIGQTSSPMTEKQKIALDEANMSTEVAGDPFQVGDVNSASDSRSTTLDIGTGSGYGTNPAYYANFCNYWQNVHTQTLYLASELGGPMLITDLQYSYERISTSPNTVIDAEIRIFETTDNTLTAGAFYDNSSATLVWSSASYVPATATGWANVIDITDYVYQGTNNLIIDVVTGPSNPFTSTYFRNHQTDGGVNRMLIGYSDSETPPNYDGVSTYYPNIRLYWDPLTAPGDLEGHVYNGDGLAMPNATVGSPDLGISTTTDATGYYSFTGIYSGENDFSAWKDGFNVSTATVNILSGALVVQDFVLTKPLLTINPLFFDETLAPNEFLTTYLGLLNTGNGSGDWTAVINYTSKAPSGGATINPYFVVENDKVRGGGTNSIGADPNAKPSNTQPSGMRFGENIAYIADAGASELYTMNMSDFSSALVGASAASPSSGDFMNDDETTMYVSANWGADLYSVDVATGAATMIAAFSGQPSGFGVNGMACDPTSNIMYVGMTDGSLTSSQIGTLDITTGVITAIGTSSTVEPGLIEIAIDGSGQMFGWGIVNDITVLINKVDGTMVELGSLGVDLNYGQGGNYNADDNQIYMTAYSSAGELRVIDPVTGGSSAVSSYPGSQMTAFGVPRTGGSLSGWLTLGVYEGTVLGNGGTQNVAVNFNATGAEVGDVYTAEIVMSTTPDVGVFTIPVTMTIYGDPLDPVTNLVAELVNMVTGQVDLSWDFTTTNPTFQYFSIKRDGMAVGTTTDLFYSDFPSAFGTYCYEVYPVFAAGTGAPAGPECVDWLIPALCSNPTPVYNEQWTNVDEQVILTLENCGDGMLDFTFPDYVSGSRFACDMEIALSDSYGDGWNGCTLDVLVNGVVVLDDITLSSGSGPAIFSFPVEGGDDISTVFTAGSYASETSYEIFDGDGNSIYTSGSGSASLPVGTVYGTCPQPSYIVDVEPAMGQIASGTTLDVVLTYRSDGFPAGLFDEALNIVTNDPALLETTIPNQMLVYIPGMLYGVVTDCNSTQGMESVTVTATGDLGETYEATTDGGGYYEMYVDEDTYDLSFVLLGFETALVDDIFAATGVETEVNATMCETPYPVQWVYADPNLADTECEVTWTLPMGPYEIIYDDGEADDYVVWTQPGGAVGVHFTPAGYPATVIGGRLNVGDGSFPAGANFLGTQMAVGVMDDDGVNGLPGTLLDSVIIDVANYGWVDFYGAFERRFTEGDFYIVMWQIGWSTNAAPVAVDTDLPTVYRSAAMLPGTNTWSISPYQDFMIRAYVNGPNEGVVSNAVGSKVVLPKVTEGPFLATSMPMSIPGTIKNGEFKPVMDENATRDMTNYTIARVSDFDPDLGPQTGTLTPIANPTTEIYNDLAFGGLDAGFYAYAVKAVYESNESVWVYSNTVAHLLANELTVEVSLCDGNDPDDAEIILMGQDYPYHILVGNTDIDGLYVFDSVIDGYYDLFVQKVGYTIYEHYGLAIFDDMTYSLVLTEKAYAPRNFIVDHLTSHATWDEPLVTALFLETFEGATFPPEEWQSSTLSVGWYASADASSDNFTIPAGDGIYAVANDDAAGSVSDGSEDYLITPMLDLRESAEFALQFSHFYTGADGESAYVEYSFDAGATWEVLESMSPVSEWSEVSIDLSSVSGIDSAPVWIAFHADDNGEWASGWAIDNVTVRNGPSPILGYYVYLNDAFITSLDVDTREWTYVDLAYGEEYTGCVRALYACGLSEAACYTWTSTYLHPPRELGDEYIYGTNEVPLMWLPPMTGTIPMTAAFKVVYVGPQLDAKGPNVEAAPIVTVIEFENADNTRAYEDLQFAFPDADASGEAGCESDGEFIYTALWNGTDYIKYDLAGNLVEQFSVAGTSGVRDLAFDGEFMYGTAANTTVYVMDFTTQTLVTTFTAPTACRAIAYNHVDETFYGCDWSTDIVNFDASGANLGSFPSGLTGVYGLAFDSWSGAAGEQFLWAYDQGANNLIQFALPAGSTTGVTIDVVAITGADPAAGAGGAYTQPALFASDKVTIGGNSQNDMVWGIELADYGGGPATGLIPDGLASFNLYQDGVNIANIPYEGQAVDEYVNHVINPLDPGTYLFDVSAVYDLTIFGFPGEFGESAWEGTDTVKVVWGFDLPFYEGWDQGTFAFQGWSFNENSENWVINSQVGDAEPSAQFNWDPLLELDYTSTLTSNPITADLLTEGDIYFDFDIMLDDRNSTGEEKLLVEVYNGSDWSTVAELVNDGSFDFTTSHINITNHAMGRVFKVRFNAVGQNSFDVVSWFVDNINIYRECQAPTDLTGGYEWSATEDFGAEICWEAPFVPGPIEEWIHWDDGAPFQAVGLTDGGTFSIAARWDAGQLVDFDGTSITKMQYIVADGFTSVILKVWTGANAGTMVYEEDVTSTSVAGMWNEVTLSTPVALDVNDELWIGYTVSHGAGVNPASCDAGPAIAGYGDMITTDGSTWDLLSVLGLNYNWNVQAFVQGSSAAASAVTPMIDNTVYDTPEGTFAQGTEVTDPQMANTATSRYITGFNIYRMSEDETEYVLYDVVDYVSGQTSYCYYDGFPEVQAQKGYSYKVTSNYASDTDACESAPAMAYEIPMDDFVYVFVTSIDNQDASTTSLYPNPAQDVVTVTSTIAMTKITVTNYVGQVVYTSEMFDATSVELNTSAYQAGVYLVKIDTDNGVVTKRVIITR